MDGSRDVCRDVCPARCRTRSWRKKSICFNRLPRAWCIRSFVRQASTVMKPEPPEIGQDKLVSPHAQEVEFALILSRMINTVKEDPSQMRRAIYQFARARLTLDVAWADEPERKLLAAALETAIQGVEQFST